MMGRTAGRGFVAYGTAKAALAHWTRLAAQDLAPRIRVNAIAVGSIATSALEIVLRATTALRTAMEQGTPLRRIGDPEEIAATVLFLASRAGRLRHRQGRRGRRRHRAAEPRHGPPRPLSPRSHPGAVDGKVEERLHAGGGLDDVGDGVDHVHGGGQAAGVVVVAEVRREAELEVDVGLALDLDAVAAPLRPRRARRRRAGG